MVGVKTIAELAVVGGLLYAVAVKGPQIGQAIGAGAGGLISGAVGGVTKGFLGGLTGMLPAGVATPTTGIQYETQAEATKAVATAPVDLVARSKELAAQSALFGPAGSLAYLTLALKQWMTGYEPKVPEGVLLGETSRNVIASGEEVKVKNAPSEELASPIIVGKTQKISKSLQMQYYGRIIYPNAPD